MQDAKVTASTGHIWSKLTDLQVTSKLLLAGWMATQIDSHVFAGYPMLPPWAGTNTVIETCILCSYRLTKCFLGQFSAFCAHAFPKSARTLDVFQTNAGSFWSINILWEDKLDFAWRVPLVPCGPRYLLLQPGSVWILNGASTTSCQFFV